MEQNELQIQIDGLNKKLDVLLDYVVKQNQKNEVVHDLIADSSIIGKDLYNSVVEELDKRSVEVDPEQIRAFAIRLLKNLGKFNDILILFESITDLLIDATPIANEVIMDISKKLGEFESKGYFSYFKELAYLGEKIIDNFNEDDIKQLAENIPPIVDTLKNVTQPKLMNSLNNAVKVYNNLDMDKVPEYSLWKLMKEMRKPEMKKTIGIAITLMKDIEANNNSNK